MIWLGTSGGACDDTWCIDAYGQLTLCVSDRMYQQMGIPGAKLKFPSVHSDAYGAPCHVPLFCSAFT